MLPNFDTAKAIAEAAHAAWNKKNIEGVLNHYVDDLIYFSNAGGAAQGSFTISGKSGLRDLLTPVLPIIDSMTTIETFNYHNGVARLRVSTYVRHRETGLDLSGSYRQILYFRDFKICRIEEFHDAAMISTFWRLVHAESRSKEPDSTL